MSFTRSPGAAMTAEAFLAWSKRRQGDARHELLDGDVFAMAPERAIHTRTKYAVTQAFERAIREAALACEALVDGMAVRVDDETVFEPDALVRCGPRLSDDAVVILDPVIVVEVASPSTRRVDALTKLTRYFRNASIMHYLIVLPGRRAILHHRRGEGVRIETAVHSVGSVRLDPPGLCIDVAALFPRSGEEVADQARDDG